METNRKNRSGINIWVLKHFNWSEKGWCCSTSIRQGSRRRIQETAWNVWGEDCNMDYQSFTLSIAATSTWSGEEHRDLLPFRGGQDKVILEGPKTGWSQKGQNKVISVISSSPLEVVQTKQSLALKIKSKMFMVSIFKHPQRLLKLKLLTAEGIHS